MSRLRITKQERYQSSPGLKDILVEQIERANGSKYMFPNSKGNMRGGNFRKRLKSTLQRAEINKRIGIHSLRHTFATECLNNQIDIYTLKIWMGHSDIKITEKYLHLTDGFFRKEMDKMPLYYQ